MSRKIDKTTIPFLENAGYGKGTNFTMDLVASLMLQYADSLVKNINYDTVLPTAICCNADCSEPIHKEGSVYCEFHASL